MTWTLSAQGHEDPHNEGTEKELLKRIVDALDDKFNTVTTFSFGGNYVSAGSLDEAKEKTG